VVKWSGYEQANRSLQGCRKIDPAPAGELARTARLLVYGLGYGFAFRSRVLTFAKVTTSPHLSLLEHPPSRSWFRPGFVLKAPDSTTPLSHGARGGDRFSGHDSGRRKNLIRGLVLRPFERPVSLECVYIGCSDNSTSGSPSHQLNSRHDAFSHSQARHLVHLDLVASRAC
jgi:hypothetical protein